MKDMNIMPVYSDAKSFATEMDAKDPLSSYRDKFFHPNQPSGDPAIYFLGNSLGLQPRSVPEHLNSILLAWEQWGVEAYTQGEQPWIRYDAPLCESMAKIVGAKTTEVAVMNTLTTNLHLLLVSFYRPTPSRNKILIEEKAFPSDHYAITSQIQFHGFDPKKALLTVKSRPNESTIHTDDIKGVLEQEGDSIALILLGGINYYSGQAFELEKITHWGHKHGCIVGYDLAHAVGNIVLHLHNWNVDFAVWCTYKYLNGGPAGPGGAFVHEKHEAAEQLPRFEGWWGNKLESRFLMRPKIDPIRGAGGWQLSGVSPLSLAPLRASLTIFDDMSISKLREKSVQLTGYLEFLINELGSDQFSIITPTNPDHRGCQLSIRTHQKGKQLFDQLTQAGIFCDWREPDVIRVAPVPLYNTFREVYQFVEILRKKSGI